MEKYNKNNYNYYIPIVILIIILILAITVYSPNSIDEFFTLYSYQIKNIQPQVTYNPTAEIAFVYVYTPNIFDYAQYSILNILSYCEKYNYGMIIYNQVFNDSVMPCWNKIACILENLKKYKYLIWIDADAIIANFNTNINQFILENPQADLLVCWDIFYHKECFNSGIMIIKNTDWSYNLFLKVWNSSEPHGHNDQNVIFQEIVKELYPTSKPDLKFSHYCSRLSHPKVKIYPENAFNTNIFNYNKGDFILHLMGTKTEARIDIMRQINTNLGLDDYNIKDCLDVINLNNDSYRIEPIERACMKNDKYKI